MADDPILLAARQALSGLAVPDGTSLLAAAQVSGPLVSSDRITLSIFTTPQDAPTLSDVRAQAETALRGVAGVQSAYVVLTNDQPVPKPSPPKLGSAAAATPKVLESVAHVIAVASGKGGVGKSTTAVNLALGLRANGLRVGILDADIHGPSIPTLLALHGQPRMGKDRRLLPMHSNGISAMSMGMMVDAETAMVWRGPMVMSELFEFGPDAYTPGSRMPERRIPSAQDRAALIRFLETASR